MQFTLPFLSFTSSRASSSRSTSDTSSPPSSRTASPPAFPTTRQLATPHFAISFHPRPPPSNPRSADAAADAENTCNAPAVSILPCAVLRGRSSGMVMRRRPSAVDLALSEERSRCDENSIERQGLDLMEPRPVDMNLSARQGWGARPGSVSGAGSRASVETDAGSAVMQPPRFVMGGIFEVMEGRA